MIFQILKKSIIWWEIKSIDNPIKSWYIFDWWYTWLDYLWRKLEVWDEISSNDYLYAKWSECPNWETANDYSEVCLPISNSTAEAQLDSQIIEVLQWWIVICEQRKFLTKIFIIKMKNHIDIIISDEITIDFHQHEH